MFLPYFFPNIIATNVNGQKTSSAQINGNDGNKKFRKSLVVEEKKQKAKMLKIIGTKQAVLQNGKSIYN